MRKTLAELQVSDNKPDRPNQQVAGPEVEQLYDQALAAFWTEQWDEAVDLLGQILSRRPGYADAARKLEVARRQQELASHYAQASAAADAGDWEQAVTRYSMVAEADPDYRDTNDRLAEAREQHQLATLQAEAERLHRAGQWAAVIKVGEQLQAIDPAAADPDGLMTSARAELAAQQRTAALAADYHNGLRLFDAGRWEQAVAAFEQVTRLDSTYQDVAALLGRSRRELEKASATLVEERAQREAEEQARRQAETEEQAQRQAEEQDRARQQKEAEDHARQQKEAEDHARQQKEAEDRARQLGEEQAHRVEEEAARRLRKEQRRRDTHQMLRSMQQRAARLLSRRWVVVVLAVSVCIGGALLLLIHVLRTPPIMGQLPADLRASCSAKGTSATCLLPDKTVVFYRLFDTAAAARADVVNGNELAPNTLSAIRPRREPDRLQLCVRRRDGRGCVQSNGEAPRTVLRGQLESRRPSQAARRDDDGQHHCAGLGKPPIQLDTTRRDALSAEGYRSRDISSRDALEPSAMDRVISITSFEGPNYDGPI